MDRLLVKANRLLRSDYLSHSTEEVTEMVFASRENIHGTQAEDVQLSQVDSQQAIDEHELTLAHICLLLLLLL